MGGLVEIVPVQPELSDPFHRLLRGNPWQCHTVLVRRAAVSAVGPFDTGLRSCEDWDLWLRIAATGAAFVPVNGEYACYRRYDDTMSRNGWRMLETGFAVIARNRRAHAGCHECRVAVAHGQQELRRLCWNNLYSEVHELLLAGRLGSYIRWVGRMAVRDFPLAWRAMRVVLNHKRAVMRGLFRFKASDRSRPLVRPLSGRDIH